MRRVTFPRFMHHLDLADEATFLMQRPVPGFRVIIAEDACTEMSEEMHHSALLAFSWVFGRIRSTEEIVKLFSTARAAG
jgi:nicotinamidase-related amidase